MSWPVCQGSVRSVWRSTQKMPKGAACTQEKMHSKGYTTQLYAEEKIKEITASR